MEGHHSWDPEDLLDCHARWDSQPVVKMNNIRSTELFCKLSDPLFEEMVEEQNPCMKGRGGSVHSNPVDPKIAKLLIVRHSREVKGYDVQLVPQFAQGQGEPFDVPCQSSDDSRRVLPA